MPEYLSSVERKVIEKVQTGEEMIFSAPTPEQLADPTFVATMPVISARVIRSLCVGEWKDISLHAKGVRITGARILEPLDLEFSTLLYPLELSRCQFDETVVLKNAITMSIRFYGSHATKGIDADELHVNGCLFLSHGFTATAPVSLLGASIGGDLDLRGAYLDHPNDCALSADGANVGGNVFLMDHFTANGTVRLLGASIGGIST